MDGHDERRAVCVEDLLTLGEAARFLRIHERSVRRKVAAGELAYVKVGGRVIFERAELEAYIARQRRRRRAA